MIDEMESVEIECPACFELAGLVLYALDSPRRFITGPAEISNVKKMIGD